MMETKPPVKIKLLVKPFEEGGKKKYIVTDVVIDSHAAVEKVVCEARGFFEVEGDLSEDELEQFLRVWEDKIHVEVYTLLLDIQGEGMEILPDEVEVGVELSNIKVKKFKDPFSEYTVVRGKITAKIYISFPIELKPGVEIEKADISLYKEDIKESIRRAWEQTTKGMGEMYVEIKEAETEFRPGSFEYRFNLKNLPFKVILPSEISEGLLYSFCTSLLLASGKGLAGEHGEIVESLLEILSPCILGEYQCNVTVIEV